MIQKKKITEKELAENVIGWLKSLNWKVYQEVRAVGGVHDIVAVNGPLIWVVECKLSRSLSLLDQVFNARMRSHFCSVAVPHGRTTQSFNYMLNHLGVGEITWSPPSGDPMETISPKLNRSANRFKDYWEKTLKDEQMDGSYASAGTADGGYYTPFKATCRLLLNKVLKNPGITFKEAMAGLKHHYSTNSSARSCLLRYLDTGVIPGIRVKRDGKNITLHPTYK